MVIKMKNNNIPAIRFKGFTEAWEQCKLGEMGYTYTGLSGKTKEDFGHGEGKFITYMNVFSNPISNIEMAEPIEIDVKQNSVLSGDIFFTTSSETPEEVGMASVLVENPQNMYLNSFCFGFRPNIILDPYYMGYMLRSTGFRKNMILLAQGISRYNISKTKVMELNVSIPILEEQNKIGLLFKELNNLITLHQRKYEKLINIKKSLLEKMFPSDGESIPKIRFRGFTEAWEQCKLMDLGRIETGNTPSTSVKEYYSEEGMLWVTPTDINSNILFNTERKLSEKGIKVARVIPANSTLCTCIASIGKNAFLPVKCAFNQQINALTPYNNNDPYFIFTNSYYWSQIMKRGAGGLTFQIVNKTEFSNIETSVPNKEEQVLISKLFFKIDNLITLHQRKYEKLKNIKKSLLNKMFV